MGHLPETDESWVALPVHTSSVTWPRKWAHKQTMHAAWEKRVRAESTQNSPLGVERGKQWPFPRLGDLTKVTKPAEKQAFWPLRCVHVWVGVSFTNICVVSASPFSLAQGRRAGHPWQAISVFIAHDAAHLFSGPEKAAFGHCGHKTNRVTRPAGLSRQPRLRTG